MNKKYIWDKNPKAKRLQKEYVKVYERSLKNELFAETHNIEFKEAYAYLCRMKGVKINEQSLARRKNVTNRRASKTIQDPGEIL